MSRDRAPWVCVKRSVFITKSRKRLFAFVTSTPFQVVGQFQCTIELLNKLTTATVFCCEKMQLDVYLVDRWQLNY